MAQINHSSSGGANLNTSGGNGTGDQGARITTGSASQAPVNARRLVADIVAQRLADDRKTRTLRDSMVPAHVTHAYLGPARHFTNALNQAIAEINKFDDRCTKIGSHNAAQNTKIPFPSLDEKALTSHLLTMIDFNPPLDKKDLSVAGEKLFAVKYFIDFALQHETAPHRQEALKKTRRVYTAVIEHTMRHLPADAKKQFAKSQTDDHSKASLYHVIKDLSAPEAKAVQKDSKGLQRLLGLSDPESFKRKMGRNFEELGPPLPKHEQGPAIALATANAEKPNHQARGWQQLQTMLIGQGGNPATMPAPIGPPSRHRFEQQEWELAKTLSNLAQGLPGMTAAMQQTVLDSITQRIGDLTPPTRGLVLLDLLEGNVPALRNQIHRLASRNLDAITNAVPYMDKVQLEQAAVHLQRVLPAVPPVDPEQVLTCAFTLMGDAGRLSNAAKTNLYLQLPGILGRLDDLGTMAPPVQKKIMDMVQALITANNVLLTNNQGSGLDNMVKKLLEVRDTLRPAIQGQVNMICAPYVERLLNPPVLATLPDTAKQAMIPLLKARLLQPRGQSVSALLKEIIGALPAYTLPHDALWQPMWAMLGPHLKYLTGPHAGQAATQIPANLNALAAGQRDTALAKLTMALTRGSVPQPLKAAMIDCVTGQLSGAGTPMAQLPYSAAALAGTLKSIMEATLQLKIVNTFDTEVPKIIDLNTRARIKASVAAAVPYLRNADGKHALQKKAFQTAFDKLDELTIADQEQVLLPLAQRWRELGTSDMRKKITAEIATRLPALVTRDPALITTLCDAVNDTTVPQSERDRLACALIRNGNEVGKLAQKQITNATQTLLNAENGLIMLANDAFKAGIPKEQQQAAFEALRHELYDGPLSLSEKSNVVMEIYLRRNLLLNTSLKDEVDMFAKGYLETWLKNLGALAQHSQAEAVGFALRHMNNSDDPDDSKLRVAKLLTQSYAGLSIDQSREAVKSISSLLQQEAHKDTDAAVDVWGTLALALRDKKNPPGESIESIGLGLQNLTGERKVSLLSKLGEIWNDIDDPNFQKMVITQLAINVGGKSDPRISDSERLSLLGKLPEDLQKRVKPDDFNALVEHAVDALTGSDNPGSRRKDLVTSLSSVLPLLDQDKQKVDVASCIIENWKSLHLDDKATAKTLFQIMAVQYRLNPSSTSQLKTLLDDHLEVMLDHVDLANTMRKSDVANLAASKIVEDRQLGKDVKIGTLLKTLTIYEHLLTGMKQKFSDCIKEVGSQLPEDKKFELANLIVKHAGDILHDQISYLKIEDKDKRFELAMAAVKAKVTTVPEHIDKFDIENVDQLFQIAKQAANYIPRHLAQSYSKFKNLTTAQRSDIVTLLVKSAPESLAEHFSEFGIEDQTEIKEWAHILAKASPLSTLRSFDKFKLQDETARIEILMVLAKEDPEHVAFYFSKLGISEDKARLAIARTVAESMSKKKLSISNLLVPYLFEFNIQSKEARTEIWSVIFRYAVNAADATTRDIYNGLVNSFLIYMESDDGNLTEHIPGLIEKFAIDADSEGTNGPAATDKQSIKNRFNSFVKGVNDPFENATVARWGWYQILQLCRGDQFEKKSGNFDAFIKRITAFHKPPETRYSLTNLLHTNCIEKDGEMTSSFRKISGQFKTQKKNSESEYLTHATLFPIPLTSIYKGESDVSGKGYESVTKILKDRAFKDLKRMAPVINALTTLALAKNLDGDLKRQLLHAALPVPGKDKYDKKDVDSFKNLVQSIGLLVQIFENHVELLRPLKINDIKTPKDIEDFMAHLFQKLFKASNVPDLPEKISKYMSRCREPRALVTYAVIQQNLEGEEKGYLSAALHDFFNTVVLADKPESSFADRRYDTSLSDHLKEIRNVAPESFGVWKDRMSFDWSLTMITATAKRRKAFDHLHDQILEHGPASEYPILSEVLENRMTLDIALQTMKDPAHNANENERDLLDFLALNESQSRTSLQQTDLLDKVIERLKHIPAKINLFFGIMQLKTMLNPSPSSTLDLRTVDQKPEFLKPWSVVDTADPEDLLLCGTEIMGSCQNIHTPNPGLNKCLMGYVLDGKYRMLAVKNSAGNIMARRMLRLMWDPLKKTPVLHLEKLYVNAGLPDGLEGTLLDLAKQKARAMGVFLVESGGEDLYGHPVVSLDSSVHFEYVDELRGIQSKKYQFDNPGVIPRYPFEWNA